MKEGIKKYSNLFVLLSSILLLILGAVIYTKPETVVIFTTYIFGGLLIIVGLYKCIKNYLDVKKDNTVSSTEMIVGIILTVCGVVSIFLAGVVEALVRLVIGGWMIFRGITGIVNAFYMDQKNRKFWISLILSFIIIGGGLYTILEANLAFKIIGIILMIYSVLEIIEFIFGTNNINIVKSNNNKKEKIIDAKLIETKDEK